MVSIESSRENNKTNTKQSVWYADVYIPHSYVTFHKWNYISDRNSMRTTITAATGINGGKPQNIKPTNVIRVLFIPMVRSIFPPLVDAYTISNYE